MDVNAVFNKFAEWPPDWERAVNSCLQCMSFVNGYQFVYVCFFRIGFEGGMWALSVFIPDHCLSLYF